MHSLCLFVCVSVFVCMAPTSLKSGRTKAGLDGVILKFLAGETDSYQKGLVGWKLMDQQLSLLLSFLILRLMRHQVLYFIGRDEERIAFSLFFFVWVVVVIGTILFISKDGRGLSDLFSLRP